MTTPTTPPRKRHTRPISTVGDLIDACRSPHTILDCFFRNDNGRWYIPGELSGRPTVEQLDGNRYLRGQTITERKRFADYRTGVGWNLYIDARFDPEAYRRG